ncbi:hypothetical protein [Tumebacillus algifaecis]|uniref:hypothetical protein n=1 Tax=Tumebacillus algifaecis TaxID=1214604 RepID=UPI0012FE6A21|nr:hypothetical protein [Tumebacillus algifaecis]
MDTWLSMVLASASIVTVKYLFSPKAERLRPTHLFIEFLGITFFIGLFQWLLE